MIVYRTRTCNTSCNTITLTYTTITSFMFDGLRSGLFACKCLLVLYVGKDLSRRTATDNTHTLASKASKGSVQGLMFNEEASSLNINPYTLPLLALLAKVCVLSVAVRRERSFPTYSTNKHLHANRPLRRPSNMKLVIVVQVRVIVLQDVLQVRVLYTIISYLHHD